MASKINHFLYRFKYNYGLYLPLRRPVDVSLELSSYCDMRCGYCYHANQDSLPFMKNHMDYEVACRIIRLSAEAGVNSLKFNWKGESTLNKDYGRIIQYARALRGGSTFIELLANSNFNFIPKKHIFDGLADLTKVKISYDSFVPSVFEGQRIKGKHDRVTRNIDIFYENGERLLNKTEMVIQAVRTQANADEDLEGEIKSRWPGVSYSIRDMVHGRNEETTEGFNSVATRRRKPCLQAFVRLIFNSKGDAMMCCPDIKEELNLGNIRDFKTMKELFNTPKAKALRRSLKSKSAFKMDPCKTCSSYESYQGFPGQWGS